MNIFFVGLMGAGKTTIGREVARYLNKRFFDSDNEIEVRSGMSIPLIFKSKGESEFRILEAQVIADLTSYENIVLATGGGAILHQDNRKCMKNKGVIVYLRASPRDLWLRTRRNSNRPLLQIDNPKERLNALHRIRDPIYRECADFVIETRNYHLSLNKLVSTVIMHLGLISNVDKNILV